MYSRDGHRGELGIKLDGRDPDVSVIKVDNRWEISMISLRVTILHIDRLHEDFLMFCVFEY